jgi:adenylyltransferase/sulfurtransferase
MNDEQLLRYSRQIMLPQVDVLGQQRLLEAHALVIGLGGLGSPVAMYLAAAGVGELVLCDFDRVELPNLQRQILHHTADLGRSKVASAADRLRALNPEVRLELIDGHLEGEALAQQVARAQVVVDASDNFATRFAVNAACVHAGIPLVSGAAIRFEGQVSVFHPGRPGSPCYRCLYREGEELRETCSETGVIAPLVGIVGSIQALEAIKVILDLGQSLAGRLLVLDALNMEWRSLKLPRDPACPVCGDAARAAAG